MRVQESVMRDIARLLFWYPGRWALVLLPASTGLFVLRRLGDLHRLIGKRKATALKRGIDLARTFYASEGAQWDNALKDAFRNHYVDRFVMFIAPKITRDFLAQHIRIQGLEHLEAALSKGNGAVVVIGHFGPVHLPLISLAVLGYSVQQIGMPSDRGLSWIGRNVAFRLRLRYEAKIPAPIILANKTMRPILEGLRKNNVVMITGDGTGTEEHFGRQEKCRFLGRYMAFPTGPGRLCEKTGASLLPMFILPDESKSFQLLIEEPILPDSAGTYEGAACCFAARLERRVGQFPGYMHFLDRLHDERGGVFSTRG